jgi:arginase
MHRPAFNRIDTAANDSASLMLIGVPFGAGAGQAGTEHAPAALRAAGLAQALGAAFTLHDAGDIAPDTRPGTADQPGCRNAAEVASWVRATRTATASALASGHRPLILGGDHSIAMGSVAAARAHASANGKKFALLWIDAHADFNTPLTSPSGNMHGMSLAYLTGAPELAWLDAGAAHLPVSSGDILIFGARSIDEGEQARLSAHHITCLRCDQRAALTAWLADIDPATTHLHVSFDVDVLDPALACGVGTPVPDGLGIAAAHEIMGSIHATGAVRSADLVEVNPALDPSGQTTAHAIALTAALFGAATSQSRNAQSLTAQAA